MGKFNELCPITETIHLGSVSSAKDFPGIHFPKKSRILNARLLNGATIAAQYGSHAKIELKAGNTVLASLSTAADEQGAISQNVGKAFNIAEGGVLVDAGTDVVASYTEQEGAAEVTRITCLSAAGLDEKYFVLNDEVGSVAVWVDEDGGATIPAGASGEDRALELALNGDEDAEGVAAALASLLNGDSKFSAIVDPEDAESVIVTSSTVGVKTDAADVDTGFGFEVLVQGEDSVSQALTNAQISVDYYPL